MLQDRDFPIVHDGDRNYVVAHSTRHANKGIYGGLDCICASALQAKIHLNLPLRTLFQW